mgnify:CR=1 FL=1
MKISTKGRYALRLMIDVAVHGGEEFVSLKDVAARQGISMKYLEQIAGLLGKGGIPPQRAWRPGGISSDESAGGVYPGQYPPADRGKSSPGGLPGDGGERLRAVRRLPDLDFWTGLYAAVNEYVDRFTLADLVREELEKQGRASRPSTD